jgi:hypothetical protein
MKIQEATKQAINRIDRTSRIHLSEKSLKIAEEALAKMRAILEKGKNKNVSRRTLS